MKEKRLLPCALLAVSAATTACTLNVRHESRDIQASYDELGWSVLRVVPEPVEHLTVYAHGEPGVEATLTIDAIVNTTTDQSGRLITGIDLILEPRGDGVLALYPLVPSADNGSRLSELHVEAPMPAGIDLVTETTDATVIGFCGPVTVQGGSADLVIESLGPVAVELGSGNISVFADLGAVRTGSGDISADILGIAVLETQSGGIDATLGAGGQVVTGSGDVTVVVTDPDFGELVVSTGSGNVSIELPAGADPVIDVTTGSGDIMVADGLLYFEGGGSAAAFAGYETGHIVVETGSGDVSVTF